MALALTPQSDQRVKVEVYDDEEATIQLQRLVNRYSTNDQTWLATLTKKPLQEVIQYLNAAYDESLRGNPFIVDVEIASETIEAAEKQPSAPDNVEPFTVTLRDKTAPRHLAQSYSDTLVADVLRSVFAVSVGNELIIEWKDNRRLACLDIDYHEIESNLRPSKDELTEILRKIKPQPLCWHPSHAGGAKLYYQSTPGFTAEEIASVAGLSWITQDARATFDMPNSSRHPCFPRASDGRPAPCKSDKDVDFLFGSVDTSQIKRLLNNELEMSDLQELLEEKGWKIGDMLPHSSCPISPDDRDRASVFVGDTGVYCHSCESRGLSNGSRPGFVSYASFVKKTDSRLGQMVKAFCHYEHAKIVVQNLYRRLNDKATELLYKTLLKVYHQADDPRIEMAMYAGKGIIRLRGIWAFADGGTTVAKQPELFVKSLPAVQVPKEDGKFSININRFVALCNNGDVSEHGYPDVTFIRGCHIYGHHLESKSEEIVKVVTRKEFDGVQPRYLPKHRRMDSVDYWNKIESSFPGINRNYLKLLIAAKGASEGRMSQCPFLLVTGVSSGAKSTTAQIAAGICGDKAEEPIFTPDALRFRQSLMDSAQASGIVVVNEIFKAAKDAKLKPLQALNPMLTITEDSRSHAMYIGSVPFGRLPLFVLTDIECPPEVLEDVQISRRFVFYNLPQKVYWESTFVDEGIRPHQFRKISPDAALAADSLLSDIIDDFFTAPTPLRVIADKLEAGVVDAEETTEEKERTKSNLYRFYKAVCHAPPLEKGSTDQQQYSSYGWKVIRRNSTSNPLLDLWNEFADGPGDDWFSSRALKSVDWSQVIGLDFPIECKYNAVRGGSKIFIRFQATKKRNDVCPGHYSGNAGKLPYWVNGEVDF
jgi:hypothetical protein